MRKSELKSELAVEVHAKRRRSAGLTISLIGAGRLGTALGSALANAGHSIDLVVTEHPASARRAARLMGARLSTTSRQLHRSRSAKTGLRESELLLISTPDDAVAEVASELGVLLAQRGKQDSTRPKRVALHTSGALSSQALVHLKADGFAVGSLHPLISVAGAKSNAGMFRDTFFCVEGDREAARLARRLVKDLQGRSFTIDAQAKPLYHAAAVMSSGHATALFDFAVAMLEVCGLSAQRAQQVLLPLLRSNTANLSQKSPEHALTGPFARGDLATVKSHLASIKAAGLTEALETYLLLGQRSLELAKPSAGRSTHIKNIASLLRSFR